MHLIAQELTETLYRNRSCSLHARLPHWRAILYHRRQQAGSPQDACHWRSLCKHRPDPASIFVQSGTNSCRPYCIRLWGRRCQRHCAGLAGRVLQTKKPGKECYNYGHFYCHGYCAGCMGQLRSITYSPKLNRLAPAFGYSPHLRHLDHSFCVLFSGIPALACPARPYWIGKAGYVCHR
jgi:hypothetical protein